VNFVTFETLNIRHARDIKTEVQQDSISAIYRYKKAYDSVSMAVVYRTTLLMNSVNVKMNLFTPIAMCLKNYTNSKRPKSLLCAVSEQYLNCPAAVAQLLPNNAPCR
jgi:hypothetical protein